jgi:integrase
MLGNALDHLCKKLRETLKMPNEFVLHSLRDTHGSRLGEAGAGVFTIMRSRGHSSVTVSQRYMHPTPEAMEGAVERPERLNEDGTRRLLEDPKGLLPATVSATLAEPGPVTH